MFYTIQVYEYSKHFNHFCYLLNDNIYFECQKIKNKTIYFISILTNVVYVLPLNKNITYRSYYFGNDNVIYLLYESYTCALLFTR